MKHNEFKSRIRKYIDTIAKEEKLETFSVDTTNTTKNIYIHKKDFDVCAVVYFYCDALRFTLKVSKTQDWIKPDLVASAAYIDASILKSFFKDFRELLRKLN